MCFFLFFKQKAAYELRISDWSSDVCSSDLTGVEDDHAATVPIGAAKAEKPAYSAALPIASSIRSISFHVAMRSERVKLPTFNCPAFQPVARWAMVTSSLSPDRAETIAPQPRATAASSAAFASVTVPTWLTLISAALHTAAAPARSTRVEGRRVGKECDS